ncbi:hypothetical protein BHE74_00021069 [Ensete ventricosum]|nr:hypothetical protein BHE74_00021069 [Ensete ventricosum]
MTATGAADRAPTPASGTTAPAVRRIHRGPIGLHRRCGKGRHGASSRKNFQVKQFTIRIASDRAGASSPLVRRSNTRSPLGPNKIPKMLPHFPSPSYNMVVYIVIATL